MLIRRRDFITGTSGMLVAAPALAVHDNGRGDPAASMRTAEAGANTNNLHDGIYRGESSSRVSFPMGGIGAGTICMEGRGALTSFSLRHRPNIFNEPSVFAAVSIRGSRKTARILEGPVPKWKRFGLPGASNGVWGKTWGLPRFRASEFQSRFPFAMVRLADPKVPLSVELTGWSPFEPGNSDAASLPVIGLEYRLTNESLEAIDGVFSFSSVNLMIDHKDEAVPGDGGEYRETGGAPNRVEPMPGGFIFQGHGPPGADTPLLEGHCAIWTDAAEVKVNHAWLRADPWLPDALRTTWQDIEEARCFDRPPITQGTPAPGATLFVPFSLAPGQAKTVTIRFAWYVPHSDLHAPEAPTSPDNAPTYKPWYAHRFASIEEVIAYWNENYADLRQRSRQFSDCLFSSTVPAAAMDAISSNLSILKSPTLLRQADGRLWAWEGSGDHAGDGGPGSCTHVWNYAQALAHLLPDLERSLRETEFGPDEGSDGFQTTRATLPITSVDNLPRASLDVEADGQLGCILKVYRDWRISGDTAWLARLWPRVRKSMDYCIRTWDPMHRGVIEEPHGTTFDVKFWGPDGMHVSLYLAALKAAILMGRTLGDHSPLYKELLQKGTRAAESDLFNGEYFIQDIEWMTLKTKFQTRSLPGQVPYYSAEELSIAKREGPRHQYGRGCLATGVLGQWLSLVCGLEQTLDTNKVRSHLSSVYRYNLKHDLSEHVNPHRATLACGDDGGLVLCTWPKDGKLTVPFPYCDEVWTGVEYQVASHLIMLGLVAEGLDVVATCRGRYDGTIRNPFDEYECGHWYGRALSSYALLQALSGARYDAVDRVLYLHPKMKGDFRCFIATSTGYGTVGVRAATPFVDVAVGAIPYRRIDYVPCA